MTTLHPTALEILDIVEKGGYAAPGGKWVDIRDLQSSATARTEVFSPEDMEALFAGPGSPGAPPRIEVLDATTQDAAQALAREPGGVVLLNFASAKNPGGGFLGGAKAQEEEVCRCSGLYPMLARQPRYYEANRAQRSLLYTDHQIYSPDVPFFRTATGAPLLAEPFVASVITAPAPNAGALSQNDPGAVPLIPATFARRWRNVLTLAHARGHRTVLLGAWGCGAFRNDPEIAASTVAPWLKSPRFAGCFDHVVFAIPDGGRSGVNLAAFRRHFG